MNPPNVLSTTVICDTATQLVTGVAAAVNAAQDAQHKLNVAFYQIGEIAWDECQCGMLGLSLGRNYLSRDFPTDTTQLKVGNCATMYHVQEAQLMIVRCFPVNGDGVSAGALYDPPTAADLQAASRRSVIDAVTAWHQLNCMLNTMFNAAPAQVGEFLVQDWVPLGPMGGCGGVTINFKMAWYRDCDCV